MRGALSSEPMSHRLSESDEQFSVDMDLEKALAISRLSLHGQFEGQSGQNVLLMFCYVIFCCNVIANFSKQTQVQNHNLSLWRHKYSLLFGVVYQSLYS